MAKPMITLSYEIVPESISSDLHVDDCDTKAFCINGPRPAEDDNSSKESERDRIFMDDKPALDYRDYDIGFNKNDLHGPWEESYYQQDGPGKIAECYEDIAGKRKASCEDIQQENDLHCQKIPYPGKGEDNTKCCHNEFTCQDSEARNDDVACDFPLFTVAKCAAVFEQNSNECNITRSRNHQYDKCLKLLCITRPGSFVQNKDSESDRSHEKCTENSKELPKAISGTSDRCHSDEVNFPCEMTGEITGDSETPDWNVLECPDSSGRVNCDMMTDVTDGNYEMDTAVLYDSNKTIKGKEVDGLKFSRKTYFHDDTTEVKRKFQGVHCKTSGSCCHIYHPVHLSGLRNVYFRDVSKFPEATVKEVSQRLRPLLSKKCDEPPTANLGLELENYVKRKGEILYKNQNILQFLFKRRQQKQFLNKNQSCVVRLELYFATFQNNKRKKTMSVTVYFHNIGGYANESETIHEEPSRFVEIPRFVDVEGKISDTAVDPPGQQSSYIPPGDIRYESYRVSTFENYPKDSVVDIRTLAENGFHYTGFFDRVKCYSCGRTVERWERGDDPKDKQYHRADCEFANGRARDNVPIVSRFQARLTPQIRGLPRQNVSAPARRSPNDNPDQFRQGDVQYQSGGITITSGRQNSSVTPSGRSNREWRLANVISADHRRFLSNLFLNREIDRLASFSRWSTGRLNVSPVSLSKAGFFYLGDMDRTQCFSCGGVLRNWTVHDNAMNEHRANFPTCHFTQGTDNRNVPVPDVQETPQELREAYPCQYPYNPHMRNQSMREDSFDHRWPAGRIQASPQEIAAAGFFFLGERDKVKCWYCNGGLQNWEVDDSPWIEHSKWFPNCQFLLQQRGQFYVFRHLSLNAHLPRPIIRRQDGAILGENARSQRRSAEVQDVPPQTGAGFSRVTAPSPPPTIIDPQEERRKQKERVEKELKESEIVKNVMAFGYGPEIVKKVLEEKLGAGEAADSENIFNGVMSLLDAVQKQEKAFEEEQRATDVKMPAGASNFMEPTPSTSGMETPAPSMGSLPPSGVAQVSGFNVDSEDEDMDLYGSLPSGQTEEAAAGPSQPEPRPGVFNIPQDQGSIKDMYEQQMDERLCKICFDNIADMVFVPCGHIACCLQCTQAIRQCPACRVRIEKAIRISMP